MERYFTTEQGTKVNVIDHIMDQLAMYPSLKIYLGTDSQVKKEIWYATVIVFRYGTRGAHYIYFLESVPKMDHFRRLFEEAARTIELATMIKEHLPSITFEALEFDYNQVKKTLSAPLVKQVKGWVESMGWTPKFKGGGMIATKAGDHICRNKTV